MEPPPVPPPQPSKELLIQRYKPVWRFFLISNFALGAYIFARAGKKDTGIEDGKDAPEVSSAPIVNTSTPVRQEPSPLANTSIPVPEEPSLSPPITEPVKVREPIPVDQQHELFKWILEEKRKVKPKDREDEKRIDEEKAILEQFIREKSIPSL